MLQSNRGAGIDVIQRGSTPPQRIAPVGELSPGESSGLEMLPSLDVSHLLCVFCLAAVRAGFAVISHRQLCQDYLRRKVITGRFHGLPTELNGHAG